MTAIAFACLLGLYPPPRRFELPRVELRCLGEAGGSGHPHQHQHEFSPGQADKRMRKPWEVRK